MALPDIGDGGQQVPVFRVDQGEQEFVARLRGIRDEAEQAVEAGRPELLAACENPAPRAADTATFGDREEFS
jgi:hypothetical protein